jgi:hypothetical protein
MHSVAEPARFPTELWKTLVIEAIRKALRYIELHDQGLAILGAN